MKILLIGGGAATYFCAANLRQQQPHAKITILEMTKQVLGKVRVSGGGRCNVTHACFNAKKLSQNYPRGQQELVKPFKTFGPKDTIKWFQKRGVELKTEADGRMFPTTDDSGTIIQCLRKATEQKGVKIITSCKVTAINPPTRKQTKFLVETRDKGQFEADRLFIGTGSSSQMWKILGELGHEIIPPVPSLFTFKVKDSRIKDLAGIAVPNAKVSIQDCELKDAGPLLITHWGFSGPAILRLSAWGARELKAKNYDFELIIDWIPEISSQDIKGWRDQFAKIQLSNHQVAGLPKRLWQSMIHSLEIPPERRWAELSKKHHQGLTSLLKASKWRVQGKSTFKEEFVTAGGVALEEVDFTRFESKIIPNLFMAGEVLNIDAVTGGFNFQAAWTGGFIAGSAKV